jgi:hypothetical protein
MQSTIGRPRGSDLTGTEIEAGTQDCIARAYNDMNVEDGVEAGRRSPCLGRCS